MPSCETCQQFFYDTSTWQRMLDEKNEPVPRWAGSPLPCHSCPKIPRGLEPKPANAVELDDKGVDCYHYELLLREDSTHIYPRDSITVTNAAIIRDVERRIEDSRQSGILVGLARISTVMSKSNART